MSTPPKFYMYTSFPKNNKNDQNPTSIIGSNALKKSRKIVKKYQNVAP